MNINSNNVIAGTESGITATISVAGKYKFQARSTFIAPSGCILTVAQSGSKSVSYTQGPPNTASTHAEIENEFDCAAGDVLVFIISSSNVNDSNGVNLLKTTFSLSQD